MPSVRMHQPANDDEELHITLSPKGEAYAGFEDDDEDDGGDPSKAGPYTYAMDRQSTRGSIASSAKSHAQLVQNPAYAGPFSTDSTPLPPFQPSLKLMFSLSTRKEVCTLIVPGIICSVASAGLQPYLTIVVGNAFDSFTRYVSATSATSSPDVVDPAKAIFMAEQLRIFITLLVMAFLTVLGSAVSLIFWNTNSEYIVRALRRKVFKEVTAKELAWFDLGMGKGRGDENAEHAADDENAEDPSSGGLSGRFAR